MDGLLAKRVLIALAKKFSYESVRRANCSAIDNSTSVPKKIQGYQLHLTRNGHSYAQLVVYPLEDNVERPVGVNLEALVAKSAKWESLLEGLAGNIVSARLIMNKHVFRNRHKQKHINIRVASIEQLMIELELEGYLKNT